NAALAAVAFVPTANWDTNTTLAVNIADGGENGSTAVTGTITLAVTPVNDRPGATNTTLTTSYTEDAATVALTDIVASDVDSGETLTATLTLANPGAGSLTTTGGGSFNAGTGVWSVTDTVSNVNAALAAVAFVPTANWDTSTTLAVNIADGGENGSTAVTGTITLAVTPVNDRPGATNTTLTTSYTEDAATVALTDIVASDVDSGETLTATLTLANPGAGSLTITGGGGFNATTGVWSLTDTVANVNVALAAVAFAPTAHWDTDTTLAVNIADGGENGSTAVTGTITLDVSPVNDRPTVTQAIADQSSSINTSLSIQLPANTFTDVDGSDLLTTQATQANGTDLPSWLTYDRTSRTFSGTPGQAEVGQWTLRVTASDGSTSVSDDFVLTLTSTESVPVANDGTPPKTNLPADAITDPIPSTPVTTTDTIPVQPQEPNTSNAPNSTTKPQQTDRTSANVGNDQTTNAPPPVVQKVAGSVGTLAFPTDLLSSMESNKGVTSDATMGRSEPSGASHPASLSTIQALSPLANEGTAEGNRHQATSESVTTLLRMTDAVTTGIVDSGVLMSTMNQAGLSIQEQKLILNRLGSDGIMAGYRTANNPGTREVGEVLGRLAAGQQVTQGDLLQVIERQGIDQKNRMSHLLAFQMVQKAQRTEMFSQALDQLDSIERIRGNVFEREPIPGAETSVSTRTFPELTGQSIAVLIGIDRYPSPVPSLGTAVNDVNAVSDSLGTLGYQTIVLKNAGYDDMIAAFQHLAAKIKPGQELIIYFAGHGYYREETATGYWIPGDVDVASSEKWISTRHISDFLSKITASRIMVISDSCYSGSLTREYGFSSDSDGLTTEEIGKRRAVMMLSSGGEEPVMDGGGDGHSVFARHLLEKLGDGRQLRTGFDLFNQIRNEVVKDAPQTPQYGAMLSAGHQVGGDYLFTGLSSGTP
ncbi:MAG: caspase family protein, partial [Magnetococcales bacterium]|nr:caspase family protein [Magnetococcales bacterium]